MTSSEFFSIIFFSSIFYLFHFHLYITQMEIFSAFQYKIFQLRTSDDFLAMTRKISKGVKISVFC